jgi:hypothetical protein
MKVALGVLGNGLHKKDDSWNSRRLPEGPIFPRCAVCYFVSCAGTYLTNFPPMTLAPPNASLGYGLDLKINRFHLVNPHPGELLILKLRSKGIAWIWKAMSLFLVGFVPLWISYDLLTTSGAGSMMIFFAVVGGLFFLAGGGYIHGALSRSKWLFAPDRLVHTSSFGLKKTLLREDVFSVYITETTGKSKGGSKTYIHYGVELRVKPARLNFGAHTLFYVDEQDSIDSIMSVVNRKTTAAAKEDALKIATVIAEHWNIPLSV